MRARPIVACCVLSLSSLLAACGAESAVDAEDGMDLQTQTQALTDITCSGENYDVNGDPSDGCERLHSGSNHSNTTAISLGSLSCSDSLRMGLSNQIFSDSRTHSPMPTGFSGVVGSAPDYYSVRATGGQFCLNDGAFEFKTSGGGTTDCYRFTVTTDRTSVSVLLNGQGSGSFRKGSTFYGNNSTVYIKIEKTCSLPTQEAVTYSVSFNL